MLAYARYRKRDVNNRNPSRNRIAKRRRTSPLIVLRQEGPEGRMPRTFDATRGLYVPLRYEVGFLHDAVAHEDSPPTVYLEMKVVKEGEPPRCVDMKIHSDYSDERISVRRFRRIPFAEYLRLAVAVAVGTKEEVTDWKPDETSRGIGGFANDWREKRVTFDELARRPVGRPPLESYLDLAEVVRIASAGQPTPTKAVEDHWRVSKSTALRYRKRARAAGYS
jgi:hypothetical protein